VWLHKGAFGCAEDIVKGKKTTKYVQPMSKGSERIDEEIAGADLRFVDYAMYRVRLMRHHGIEPYIVFDGGPLPAKKKTEVSREK
jgi:exonuclease-1